jgi:hypothetical protein
MAIQGFFTSTQYQNNKEQSTFLRTIYKTKLNHYWTKNIVKNKQNDVWNTQYICIPNSDAQMVHGRKSEIQIVK